jgi:hypothetical protein
MLNDLLKYFKNLFNNFTKSMPPSDSPIYRMYTSVPGWKPWRDY